MATFAVDARHKVAQRLAPDAKLDCPNMTESGRFQYVVADSAEEAVNQAVEKYRNYLAGGGKQTWH